MFNKGNRIHAGNANNVCHYNYNDINHNRHNLQNSHRTTSNMLNNHYKQMSNTNIQHYNNPCNPSPQRQSQLLLEQSELPQEKSIKQFNDFYKAMRELFEPYIKEYKTPTEHIQAFAAWLHNDFFIRDINHVYVMNLSILDGFLTQ